MSVYRSNSCRSFLLAVTLLLAPLARAQAISSGCSNFLVDLDADKTLRQCTQGLLSTTASFNPVGQAGDTSNASLSGIKTTLGSICSHGVNFCSAATLQATLTEFSGNCTAELSSPTAVDSVINLYDAIYTLQPFKTAICSTNPTTGNACLLEIAGAASSDAAVPTSAASNATVSAGPSSASVTANSTNKLVQYSKSVFNIQEYAGEALVPQFLYQAASSVADTARRLLKRAPAASSSSLTANSTATSNSTANDANGAETVSNVVTFNSTTFSNSHLLFLFLSSDMPSKQLCAPCTKQVMAAYVAWESAFPYGAGLSNSVLLGDQPAFWKGLGATCGSGFLDDINKLAGQVDVTSKAESLKTVQNAGALLAVAALSFVMFC